jgi:hypothetical protein
MTVPPTIEVGDSDVGSIELRPWDASVWINALEKLLGDTLRL